MLCLKAVHDGVVSNLKAASRRSVSAFCGISLLSFGLFLNVFTIVTVARSVSSIEI